MAARAAKSKRKKKSFIRRVHPTLLAIAVGVLFLWVQAILLPATQATNADLSGVLTSLWILGGIAFVAGIIHSAQETKWATLLLATPALTFGLFCLLLLLSGLGHSALPLLNGL